MSKNFNLVINTAYLTEEELCELLRRIRAIYELEQIDKLIEVATEKMAEAIAQNSSVKAYMLETLYKKYPRNLVVVKKIVECQEIDESVLHEVFRDRYAVDLDYEVFTKNRKASEQDLNTAFLAVRNLPYTQQEIIYLNLVKNRNTPKHVLIALSDKAQLDKNYDLLIALMKRVGPQNITLR